MARKINLFQGSANITDTTSTTSKEILAARGGNLVRTQLIIQNSSTTAILTLAKSDKAVVNGVGIVLQPLQTYIEATDGGFNCYQGAIQAISDVDGSISGMESFEEVDK